MKKLAYVGMFLLGACSSAPSASNAQAATSTSGSCCAQKAEKASCCSEIAAPTAEAKSCCEDGAKKN
jgi:hypothetical protein